MTYEDIKKEFDGVEGINEAKKIYRRLAKVLHPDIDGGNEESFKHLNNIYNEIIEHKIFFSNDTKIDIELEKIISLILHFENITIELIGSWIWVSNVDYKDKSIISKLKEIGFKWAKKKQMWYFGEKKVFNGGKTKTMEEIKSKYDTTTFKSKGKNKLTA